MRSGSLWQTVDDIVKQVASQLRVRTEYRQPWTKGKRRCSVWTPLATVDAVHDLTVGDIDDLEKHGEDDKSHENNVGDHHGEAQCGSDGNDLFEIKVAEDGERERHHRVEEGAIPSNSVSERDMEGDGKADEDDSKDEDDIEHLGLCESLLFQAASQRYSTIDGTSKQKGYRLQSDRSN